ncbi:MAG: hypothetical protein H0T98_11410 [Euzebyaceae bacterium]|nr:hypothetical protein [Euzebyaceae bacterium]
MDRPVPLSRNRDYVALWVGQVLSMLGVSVSSLAYPLLVLAVTGRPPRRGWWGRCRLPRPSCCGCRLGAFADRWHRRAVMLGSDAGRALAVGGWPQRWPFDAVTLGHILVVAFVEGALGVLFVLLVGSLRGADRHRQAAPLRVEISQGVAWLWRRPELRAITLWLGCVTPLLSGLGLVVPVLAQDRAPPPRSSVSCSR